MVRAVVEKDYISLVELYKNFFVKHNVFQKSRNDVILYLKEQTKKNPLLVCEKEGQVEGAVYLVNTQENLDGSHKVWKFRHFAFESGDAALELLVEAENRIRQKSKTGKIELTIAETEPGINFYKKNGYEQEGVLMNHYRWGEACFVLSKSFS